MSSGRASTSGDATNPSCATFRVSVKSLISRIQTELVLRDSVRIDVFATVKPLVSESALGDGCLSCTVGSGDDKQTRSGGRCRRHRDLSVRRACVFARAKIDASFRRAVTQASAVARRCTARSLASRITSASSSSVGSVSGAIRSRDLMCMPGKAGWHSWGRSTGRGLPDVRQSLALTCRWRFAVNGPPPNWAL